MVLILMESETVPEKLRALSAEPGAKIGYFRAIASRVQSYLAIKTILSLVMGGAVGVWAYALGIDFAVLWGLLAFALNYIRKISARSLPRSRPC